MIFWWLVDNLLFHDSLQYVVLDLMPISGFRSGVCSGCGLHTARKNVGRGLAELLRKTIAVISCQCWGIFTMRQCSNVALSGRVFVKGVERDDGLMAMKKRNHFLDRQVRWMELFSSPVYREQGPYAASQKISVSSNAFSA